MGLRAHCQDSDVGLLHGAGHTRDPHFLNPHVRTVLPHLQGWLSHRVSYRERPELPRS